MFARPWRFALGAMVFGVSTGLLAANLALSAPPAPEPSDGRIACSDSCPTCPCPELGGGQGGAYAGDSAYGGSGAYGGTAGPEAGVASAGGAPMPTIQGDTTWGGHYVFPGVGITRPDVNNVRTVYPDATLQPVGVNIAEADWAIGFGYDPLTNDADAGVALASPILGYDMINWAENGSIIPQNRVFFDYRHFDSVGYLTAWNPGPNGTHNFYTHDFSVDRYVLGFERTFWNGLMSFEARLPFHSQADARLNLTYEEAPDNSLQIGNIGFAWKTYLVRRRNWVLTGGLGLQLPTAVDTQFVWDVRVGPVADPTDRDRHTAELVQANETVWLTPFFGLLLNPEGRMFAQTLFQVDVPLNTSHASLNYDIYPVNPDGTDVERNWANLLYHYSSPLGISFDPLLRIDTQIGYWLYQNPCATLSSLAAILEVNCTSTLGAAEGFSQNIVNLGPAIVANIGRTETAVGMLVPVTEDQAYEWELAVRLNRRF